MKEIMKKIVKMLPVVVLVLGVVFATTYVDAKNHNTNIEIPNIIKGTASNKITGAVGNVWATVITIVQILAIGAVVFAGLKYMMSSADQKADIKKSMGTLAIGAILVFCASTVIKFITGAASQII